MLKNLTNHQSKRNRNLNNSSKNLKQQQIILSMKLKKCLKLKFKKEMKLRKFKNKKNKFEKLSNQGQIKKKKSMKLKRSFKKQFFLTNYKRFNK